MMKKFEKLLKGHKYLLFLDFEGTQFSHEMIAFGAILTKINKNGLVTKYKEPIKYFVKCKNKIGSYITQMTGIDNKILQKEGIEFKDALIFIKKYVGIHFKDCSFITFANHDLRILNQSFSYNLDADKDICSHINKNYIDFANFMNEFVKDENNNSYSLVRALNFFNVPEAGTAHDPVIDAINLMNLFNAFFSNKDLVIESYKKVIHKANHLPIPIQKIIEKLNNNENVSPKVFEDEIKNYLT